MSAPAVQLPDEEEANGLRLVSLLNKATKVLRGKFHEHYSTDPKQLYKEILVHKQKLLSSIKKKALHIRQYSILLPGTGETDSSKFDISLLLFALRVLCPIQPPVTGWTHCHSPQINQMEQV